MEPKMPERASWSEREMAGDKIMIGGNEDDPVMTCRIINIIN